MKNINGFSIKLTTLFVLTLNIIDLKSQTPGPFYQSLTPPASFSNSISLTPSSLGIGRVLAPDGWQELRYCQPNNVPMQKGLIITRENCDPNVIGAGSAFNDYIYETPVEGGTGGTVIPNFSIVPIPYTLGTIPFSYYSPYNPTGPNNPSPFLNLHSGQQPMFQVRTVEYPSTLLSTSGSLKSRFIVMPDGNTGINTEDPRAALDVQDANVYNTPIAIFGNVLPFNLTNLPNRTNTGGAAIKQTFTRHLAIVPRLNNYGFNMISHSEDIGLIFTDGLGVEGSNTSGALVIAPYTKDKNSGGLRIESNGNAELRGNLRCTKVIINAKWWPDFVFSKDYKLMSLIQIDSFIQINNHLPGFPSEQNIIENGQDLAKLQVLQQGKIEELTLYAIDQDKKIKSQEILIGNQKKILIEQELRLKRLEAIFITK
jgi:hypothetical protein